MKITKDQAMKEKWFSVDGIAEIQLHFNTQYD